MCSLICIVELVRHELTGMYLPIYCAYFYFLLRLGFFKRRGLCFEKTLCVLYTYVTVLCAAMLYTCTNSHTPDQGCFVLVWDSVKTLNRAAL